MILYFERWWTFRYLAIRAPEMSDMGSSPSGAKAHILY